MPDKPEKTEQLVAVLKAAVPFEVELLPSTLARMRLRSPTSSCLRSCFCQGSAKRSHSVSPMSHRLGSPSSTSDNLGSSRDECNLVVGLTPIATQGRRPTFYLRDVASTGTKTARSRASDRGSGMLEAVPKGEDRQHLD